MFVLVLPQVMWASGCTSVLMVKVDKEKVPAENFAKFRDHVDAHNKHIVRLAEKEVTSHGKKYQACASTSKWSIDRDQ